MKRVIEKAVRDFLIGLELSHNSLPEMLWHKEGGAWIHLEFMEHDFGCWAILSTGTSEADEQRINIGTYNSVKDIKNLISIINKSD